jgi:hypothetical protein
MKKIYILLFLIMSICVKAQVVPCNNVDFENGTTSGWVLNHGFNYGINLPCDTCANLTGAVATIVTATSTIGSQCNNGNDIYGGFPVVAPGGGTYSLLLNNDSFGGKVQQIKQMIAVGTSNYVFSLQYAAVLQNGGHPVNQQPYFSVKVYDVMGNLIPCEDYLGTPGGNATGWIPSGYPNVNYLPWTTISFNFIPYMGTNVTIVLTVSDCNQGGHFGYVYLDANCTSSGGYIWNQIRMCRSSNVQQIIAPPGYKNCQWYGPNNSSLAISGPNGTNDTLTILNGNVGDVYNLDAFSFSSCATRYNFTLDYLQIVSQYYASTTGVIVGSGTINECVGDSVQLVPAGGLITTYTWSANAGGGHSSVKVSPSIATIYTLTGTDVNGCIDSAQITIVPYSGCVWPGDANEDLVVDNNDLMPIGLKYGYGGHGRQCVPDWYGCYCNNWNDTLSNGKNTKYADCNGDSVINMSDTLYIHTNYGLNHSAKQGASQIIQTTNPDIYLQFDKPQYAPGDTVNASVLIGSGTIPQTNFYGSAFTLNYDRSKVQVGTEKFWFNNSWVGNINQSKIKFSKLNTGSGTVAASLVRITHTDTTGFGKVATLQFVLQNALVNSELYFTISNAIKTDNVGITTSLNTSTDSVAIVNNTMSINSSRNNQFSIYPNPTNNNITITSTKELGTISIYNSLGEIVFTKESKPSPNPSPIGTTKSPEGNEITIDVSRLAAGIYTVHAQTQFIKLIKN